MAFETGAEAAPALWISVDGPGAAASGTVEFVLDARWRPDRRAARRRPADIFVYAMDTLRADALAPYGGDAARTPRVASFQNDAVTYLAARAASTWTLPSVASLLSGVYPDRHGVMGGDMILDPGRVPILPGLLKASGYRTVGISQSFVVSQAYGLSNGFDDFYLSNQLNGWQLRSQDASGLLAAWLQQRSADMPVFAYLHTVDPHAPYLLRRASATRRGGRRAGSR